MPTSGSQEALDGLLASSLPAGRGSLPSVECLTRLEAADREAVSQAFGSESWPLLAAAWTEACVASDPTHVEARYLLAREADRLVAFGIVYLLPRMNLATYLGAAMCRAGDWLHARGMVPLGLRAAFWELALTDHPTVFVVPGVPEGPVVQAMVERLCMASSPDVMCLKVDKAPPAPLVGLPFVDSALLAFPHESFEAYMATRSRNRREQIRRDEQRFARAAGRVERLEAAGPQAATLVELHRRTRRSAEAKDSPRLPIEVTETFFTHYDALPASSRCVVVARVEDAMAGCLVLLIHGDTLTVTLCGLDYDRCLETRAYFVMWYECLRIAAERGCTRLVLGSMNYTFKERLGAVRVPTSYGVQMNHPVLRVLATPVLKALAGTFATPG
jgi:hypothetical protein